MAHPFDSERWTARVASLKTSSIDPLRISYISCSPFSTQKNGTILLIHGFPQTSYQFRHVITPLADAGYFVIAPDYRGAGTSSKPSSGYEKMQMAEDLYLLVTQHLGIQEKVHVVGHDIGGMVAWAYAARYPDNTASLVWGERPLPGTQLYEEMKTTDTVWHFVFHKVPDLPEALTAGRERIYLKHFFDKICVNSAFLSDEDVDVYVRAFEQPGAMKAGFGVYRSFEQDAEDNRQWIQKIGKVNVPTLGLFGRGFALAEGAESMLNDMHAEGKTEISIVDDWGHYIAEEQPERFVALILSFVGRHGPSL